MMKRNTCLTMCAFALGIMAAVRPALWAAEAEARARALGGSSPEAGPAQPVGLASALGVTFVEESASTLIVERDGKKYLVDLNARTIQAIEAPSAAPAPRAGTSTALTAATSPQAAPAAPKKETRGAYEAGDDYIFSLPTGRRVDRHGLHINFTHRFAFTPTFSGPARGNVLFGLDGFALPSFGFRYGVTDKLSVSIFRSPTFNARPIQLMAAYNFTDERDGQPLNTAFRFSVEGQDHFRKNYTYNLEGIFSRSITRRAQIYAVPTVSIDSHRLVVPRCPPEDQGLQDCIFRSSAIAEVPGFNTFSLGVAGVFDVRPTLAVFAEVIPTIHGGRSLGIHRPAYSFGIQKKIFRHSFTLGFTNGPGVTVGQRGGTRASYLGNPSADTPSGLTIGFNLTRQIY